MAAGQAAFQVDKYSWSFGGTDSGKASYKHLKGDNVYLILRGTTSPHGQLVLQIIQGTAVLNEIDLAKHIDIATSTRETFRRVNRHVADKQLPTYAVASGVKLAITHRSEDDRINRMQVAMTRLDDCNSIISTLRHRGMIFVEASSQHASRPTTSQSDLRSVATHFTQPERQSTSISNTFDRIARGTQSQRAGPRSPAPSFTRMGRPSAASPPVFLPSNSSHGSRSSALPPLLSSEPFLKRDDHGNKSSALPPLLSSEPFLKRDEQRAPRSLQLEHPLAAHVFPRIETTSAAAQNISATPNRQSWLRPGSMEDLLPPEGDIPAEIVRRERSRSSSVLSFNPLPKPTLSEKVQGRSSAPEAPYVDQHLGKLLSGVKVASQSASVPHGAGATGPFARLDPPVSTSVGIKTTPVRRRESSAAPPGTPNVLTRSKRKLFELESQNKDDEDYIAPALAPVIAQQTTISREHSRPGLVTLRYNATSPKPAAASMPPPQLLPTSNGSRSSPKDMNELLYGKRPKIAEATKVADDQVKPSATDAGPSTSATTSTDLMSAAEKVIWTSEAINLSTYARLSMTERQRALERFMIEMLGNSDFATLCRDMSTCWQSLALL